MHQFLLLLVLSTLASGSVCHAEIYKTTDKDGKIIYTDTPPSDGKHEETEKVDLPEITTFDQDRVQNTKNRLYFEEERIKQENADAEAKKKAETKQAAKKRVKDAEKALEEAKVLKAGDFFRNLNGAIIHNEKYKSRVKAAEKDLQEAQEAYNNIQ